MKFSELSSLPVVNLYAGDVPDMPEYQTRQLVGLSLVQEDKWHIRHDVTKPLPIPGESVDIYQSEDVFEHIEFDRLPATISEIYRVLKKGGLFRLSLPDYRCDVLVERSLKDADGNIIFDPGGGGAFKRRPPIFGKKKVVKGGHVWFPVYENIVELFANTRFSSVEFLHYYDETGAPHTNPIDYSKGYVKRTPDNDERVAHPFRPMSIVVDCIK
ncbi:class I SAM-dependent methyltransferase [Mycobacterium barrassiae]|uniref:methyltransferase domain-containing protein n=1 Tax=Mycobacterium barrassiae TaxID=319709 RepID=UPI002265BE1B|nr:class I SAM-dependent methyltransferase [Mycobacterium barrassiae]MCV7298526.1 class I SAM-dependent methyltransferase [Mycobacterium barrassiae]